MYEILSGFAQTWGMFLFILVFAVAAAYAFWPKNRDKFEEAAHLPLDDHDRPAAADDRSDRGDKDRSHD